MNDNKRNGSESEKFSNKAILGCLGLGCGVIAAMGGTFYFGLTTDLIGPNANYSKGNPELTSEVEIPTTIRTIPTVEYVVQSGDSLIKLIDSEFLGPDSPFSTNSPYNTFITMEGDLPTVSYLFDFEDLISNANPSYDKDKGLMAGEVLTVPDLNRNGCVNGQCTDSIGTFVLTGNRTERTYSVGSRGQTQYDNEVTKKVEFVRKIPGRN